MNPHRLLRVLAAAGLVVSVCSAQISLTRLPDDFMPMGMSDDGRIVIGQPLSNHRVLLRWTRADGVQQIWSNPASRFGLDVMDVSSSGEVVIGMDHLTVVRVTPEGSVNMTSPMNSAFAWEISGDGSTVVGSWALDTTYEAHAFRWVYGEEPTSLAPGFFTSEARAVSDDGSVVVGIFLKNLETPGVFRWTAATGIQELPWVGYAYAASVSGDGKRIYLWTNTGEYAWTDEDGLKPARDPGASGQGVPTNLTDKVLQQLLEDEGIESDGWTFRYPSWILDQSTAATIEGRSMAGETTYFLVTGLHPVPEPSAHAGAAILVLAAALLVRKRTRPTREQPARSR